MLSGLFLQDGASTFAASTCFAVAPDSVYGGQFIAQPPVIEPLQSYGLMFSTMLHTVPPITHAMPFRSEACCSW